MRYSAILERLRLALFRARHVAPLRAPETPAASPGPAPAQQGAPRDPIRSHYDAFLDGKIMGWVWDPANPGRPVSVQLRLGGEPVFSASADTYREDLHAAGMNEGRCGFSIDVPPEVAEQARATGREVSLTLADGSNAVVCRIDLAERLSPDADVRATLRKRLAKVEASIERARLAAGDHPGPQPAPPARPAYGAFFETPDPPPAPPRSAAATGLWPFAEHVRRCQQLEGRFSPDVARADFDHFHRWYIDDYGMPRKPLRVPLSAEAIRYLNETITIAGHAFPVTRAMLWYLLDVGNARYLASLDDEMLYRDLLFWWVGEQAPSLGVEDCLITRQQVDFLRRVPHHWSREAFPLSSFMEVMIERRLKPVLTGSIYDVGTRLTAYVLVLLEAVGDPGLLRFVPDKVLERLFARSGELFDRLVGELDGNPQGKGRVDVEALRFVLWEQGFDLTTRGFRSIDARGHRVEAARRPVPTSGPIVDVQVVGPFSKISGIARACQISRDILRQTDLSCSFVDFTLDNPQPGTAAPIDDARCSRSRINLIHLNADTLPNAFAYLPDVFTGAYNIGFFFWELNEPAACHELALRLVDEIWVASEYNRSCFAAKFDKPVVNVGMAIADMSGPNRSEARLRLNRRLGIEPRHFVFLSTYDSLSYLQRKNPLGALRAFQAAFPDDDDVCFVLKTHNADSLAGSAGEKYWNSVIQFSEQDRRIKIVNETIAFEALMDLKAAADCYVSLHRSEGFGFGMVEAMALGVPVLCTGYSGNMDFCSDATAWLVGWDETALGFDDYAHVSAGHRWATPRHASAVAAMRAVRTEADERGRRALEALASVKRHYGMPAAERRYAERLRTLLGKAAADRAARSAPESLAPEPTP